MNSYFLPYWDLKNPIKLVNTYYFLIWEMILKFEHSTHEMIFFLQAILTFLSETNRIEFVIKNAKVCTKRIYFLIAIIDCKF